MFIQLYHANSHRTKREHCPGVQLKPKFQRE